jgi:hypothetical protein
LGAGAFFMGSAAFFMGAAAFGLSAAAFFIAAMASAATSELFEVTNLESGLHLLSSRREGRKSRVMSMLHAIALQQQQQKQQQQQ